MPGPPDLITILDGWWGGNGNCYGSWARGRITLASNYLVGGNPLYQVSDFLAFYPKFGTDLQALATAVINQAGSGYSAADIVEVVQTDAQGGKLTVSSVDGGGGVTGLAAVDPNTAGTGYQVATALPTSGGGGTGLTVNITQISQYASAVGIPEIVIQAYLNLANACLQQVRWQELWRIGMGLYIAHFLTLYLRSEGAIGSTPQQVAASGLEKGIKVSEAAGDVSKTNQLLEGLEEWGAWQETTYGTQLITFAKGLGPRSIYVY